jgi:hypothetical protein
LGNLKRRGYLNELLGAVGKIILKLIINLMNSRLLTPVIRSCVKRYCCLGIKPVVKLSSTVDTFP